MTGRLDLCPHCRAPISPGRRAEMVPGVELVRMSTEVIDRLTDGSEPVVVLRTERQKDGTVDLILQNPPLSEATS